MLKPGGALKAMVYHLPSWVGLMLKVNFGWLRGNFRLSARQAMFDHLESLGTKGYTTFEAQRFLSEIGFTEISLNTRLSAGDLLEIKPSQKISGLKAKCIWAIYPRWLVRMVGHKFGLNLLISASKPE